VVYDNTCLPYGAPAPAGCGIVYIHLLALGETSIDDGRMPERDALRRPTQDG